MAKFLILTSRYGNNDKRVAVNLWNVKYFEHTNNSFPEACTIYFNDEKSSLVVDHSFDDLVQRIKDNK